MTITQMFEKNGPPPSTTDWRAWLQRWDAQQTGYLPDREERFNAMFHVLHTLLPPGFVALDLACGPGSSSQRLLARFPQARSVAVDLDPVLLTLGQNALGDMNGRLRWVEADLAQRDWVEKLGDVQFDAVLSTTALHWLQAGHLVQLFNTLAKAALLSGEVHLIGGENIGSIPLESVPVLRDNSDVTLLTGPATTSYVLQMNFRRPPFDDPKVRGNRSK